MSAAIRFRRQWFSLCWRDGGLWAIARIAAQFHGLWAIVCIAGVLRGLWAIDCIADYIHAFVLCVLFRSCPYPFKRLGEQRPASYLIANADTQKRTATGDAAIWATAK